MTLLIDLNDIRRTLRSSVLTLKLTSSLQMFNSALIESSNFVVPPSPDSQHVVQRSFLARLHIWRHFSGTKQISEALLQVRASLSVTGSHCLCN